MSKNKIYLINNQMVLQHLKSIKLHTAIFPTYGEAKF